ncbi:restriction endonuclease [Alphaproteobacteria bacterium]|nr:restriction endonuclease [Alphaproteobacteria bacterium]
MSKKFFISRPASIEASAPDKKPKSFYKSETKLSPNSQEIGGKVNRSEPIIISPKSDDILERPSDREPTIFDFEAPNIDSFQLANELQFYEKKEPSDWYDIIPKLLAFPVVFGLMKSSNSDPDIVHYIAALFTAIPLTGFVFEYFAKQVHDRLQIKLTPQQKEKYDDLRGQYLRRRKYESAVEKWSYFNLTISIGYWTNKKGIDLENSFALMLQELGWDTKLTSTTGDAGIDVICKKGGQIVLVQCKGHASPLGVSAIRDAAGVKMANGPDYMIVVAPNGFTKGSIEFAAQSGVGLLGVNELIDVAKGTALFP